MEPDKDGKFGRRGWVPRFTVRRLMVAVAVVGIAIGGIQLLRLRWQHLERAAYHASLAQYYVSSPQNITYWEDRWSAQFEGRRPPRPWTGAPPFVPAMVAYQKSMSARYEHAARYPWLPVETDPPEPE